MQVPSPPRPHDPAQRLHDQLALQRPDIPNNIMQPHRTDPHAGLQIAEDACARQRLRHVRAHQIRPVAEGVQHAADSAIRLAGREVGRLRIGEGDGVQEGDALGVYGREVSGVSAGGEGAKDVGVALEQREDFCGGVGGGGDQALGEAGAVFQAEAGVSFEELEREGEVGGHVAGDLGSEDGGVDARGVVA